MAIEAEVHSGTLIELTGSTTCTFNISMDGGESRQETPVPEGSVYFSWAPGSQDTHTLNLTSMCDANSETKIVFESAIVLMEDGEFRPLRSLEH